jgi:hypothetical protein
VIRLPTVLAAALAAVALAASGCGGGDGGDTETTPPVETTEAALTKADLIAQGDAICAEVNAAVGALSSASETASSARVAQEAELYGGMVERLKGLGSPREESAGYGEFIAAAEELDQAESDVRLASDRGDEGTLAEAQSSAGAALTSFQEAAENYGFQDCSEAPSAPTPTPGAEGGEELAPEGEVEEAAPEEVEEAAPEEAAPEEAGGGAPAGGGTGGGTETPGGGGGGSSGGIGPG